MFKCVINLITEYEGMNFDPKIGSKLEKNTKKLDRILTYLVQAFQATKIVNFQEI